MGRRVVHASGFGSRKCAIKQHPHQDRISLLPDEILISIISSLTFKEAAQTSVLSQRWKHLWTYVTCLDFDAMAALDMIAATVGSAKHKRLLRSERGMFANWVYKVMQSHKALALDEFRVDFDFDKKSQKEIDKWVQYAFANKVKRLELNLGGTFNSYYDFYNFDCGSLGLRSLRSEKNLKNLFVDFNPLRELSLTKVKVSGEVLEFFLHNCKFLERLVVHYSTILTHLEVSGPSLALQHLEICRCWSLKSLIVCNANLVSLKISRAERLVLRNVPLLAGICVCGYSVIFKDGISRLSCYLPKLEVLTLAVQLTQVRQVEETLSELPQLTKLKQLTLIVDKSGNESILGLTSLIRASPNLEKFVLKMAWFIGKVRGDKKLEKGVNYPLQHLKVFELCGYWGCASELELVKYILENAIFLEKIIINPRRVFIFGNERGYKWESTEWELKEIEEEEDARRHAKQQLERLVPSHVGLTIL